MNTQGLSNRKKEIFEALQNDFARQTDVMFAYLMIFQWVASIAFACFISPVSWNGEESSFHPHIYAAVVLGGLLSSLPVFLVWRQKGLRLNRHVIAVAQMLYSALLVHLTGGRIESHFHIFGSLAFLAVYRDPKVLITATFVTLADHLLRGYFWPESIYGVLQASPWRALEHGGWVVYEVGFLIYSIRGALRGMGMNAETQAKLEESLMNVEHRVQERTAELVAAQQNLLISAKNSALGEMAGQIAHEINTPLGAIVLTAQALERRLEIKVEKSEIQTKLQFILQISHKMARIINSMRRFARQGGAEPSSTNVHDLVEDTLILCEGRFKKSGIDFKFENSTEAFGQFLCKPNEISQVLLNLLNNAIDAVKDTEEAKVRLTVERDETWLRFSVSDSGPGVSPQNRSKLFTLQFTTKSADNGTGLGLPICNKIIQQHNGRIFLDETRSTTTFTFELPVSELTQFQERAG